MAKSLTNRRYHPPVPKKSPTSFMDLGTCMRYIALTRSGSVRSTPAPTMNKTSIFVTLSSDSPSSGIQRLYASTPRGCQNRPQILLNRLNIPLLWTSARKVAAFGVNLIPTYLVPASFHPGPHNKPLYRLTLQRGLVFPRQAFLEELRMEPNRTAAKNLCQNTRSVQVMGIRKIPLLWPPLDTPLFETAFA
ncbi:uncharacterized protein LOC115629294 isoform X2 [Scaptodrosophila lebanonensis]|uniref:Uncharacterized protein LOC115629294 isoform X2 n=1 Tax=Drosophila lebanonensis TaxID=7225 RepID=A0A6J2U385_DROLE|nr:uncharacterized protein LOC115629294 isoform X2 [Scaptodrosophila lebanonensis]